METENSFGKYLGNLCLFAERLQRNGHYYKEHFFLALFKDFSKTKRKSLSYWLENSLHADFFPSGKFNMSSQENILYKVTAF